MASVALAVPELTVDQALEIQGLSIAGFKKAGFQLLLHRVWDSSQRMQALKQLRLDVQGPIIAMFGFDESVIGLSQCRGAIARLPGSPELAKNDEVLRWLLDPSMQEERPDFVPGVELPKPWYPSLTPSDLMAKGSRWIVVGGERTGGVLVRRGEDLQSPFYRYRLLAGAQLRAEEVVVGNRLHYRRLAGDGPDFGWVTLESKGCVLVKPDVDETARERLQGIGSHALNGLHQQHRAPKGKAQRAILAASTASLAGLRVP